MDINDISNSKHLINVLNTGNLEKDFYKYAKDFYESALIVNEYLLKDDCCDIAKLDTWYFSLMYLYRQSIELILKSIIFQTISDDKSRLFIISNVKHDVCAAFKEIVTIKNLDIKNKNLKWVYNYLQDISLIDRDSDMFRYPFGHDDHLLFKEQKGVSLEAVKTNMETLFKILNDVYCNNDYLNNDYDAFEPKLIIEGGDYYNKSVVGYGYLKKTFYPYYKSYLRVANFIKDIIIKYNKTNLFMPMCYMYRNAVELGLKRIIIESSHFDNDKKYKIIRKKKHSLLGLWNSVCEEMNNYENASSDKTLDYAKKYIEDFHNFDNTSDIFRYPCNKNLDSYFIQSKTFGLENISDSFLELCNLLDGIDAMLSNVKEMESEMYSYYL